MSRFGVIVSGFSAPSGYARPSVRASGQVDTVAALAARLDENWVPDSAERFNALLECVSHPDTAWGSPTCGEAMGFLIRHARLYTTSNGANVLVAEPLIAGDPWLPLGVWLNRHWYRQLPSYHAVAGIEGVTWSLPAGADGGPPAGTQPLVAPTPIVTTPAQPIAPTPGTIVYTLMQDTPAHCSAMFEPFAGSEPVGVARSTVLESFRQLHPTCTDWANAQAAVAAAPAATPRWLTPTKIAIGVGALLAAGIACKAVTWKAL